MDTLKHIRNCNWYFCILLVFIASGFALLLTYGKAGSFISLNYYHSLWLDNIFIKYTLLGDGIFSICVIVLSYLLIKIKKQSFALLLSLIISSFVAQILKNIFNSPRPKLFFGSNQYLHFIEGVSLSSYSSFPSGHTATAFAMATVLVCFIKNKNIHIGILIAAVLVGYSRIYLGQHFLMDVLVGALVGTLTGLISFQIAMNVKPIKFSLFKFNLLQQRKSHAAQTSIFST